MLDEKNGVGIIPHPNLPTYYLVDDVGNLNAQLGSVDSGAKVRKPVHVEGVADSFIGFLTVARFHGLALTNPLIAPALPRHIVAPTGKHATVATVHAEHVAPLIVKHLNNLELHVMPFLSVTCYDENYTLMPCPSK